MKLSIEDIQIALQEAKIDQNQQSKVLNYLNAVLKEEKDNTKPLKQKNEFGIIIYDVENQLKGKEFTASVYTIKQNEDHGLVLGKISEAARGQNESAKNKNNIISTIGSACQNLKRVFIKEQGVNIKTKNTVRVIISNNQLI